MWISHDPMLCTTYAILEVFFAQKINDAFAFVVKPKQDVVTLLVTFLVEKRSGRWRVPWASVPGAFRWPYQ